MSKLRIVAIIFVIVIGIIYLLPSLNAATSDTKIKYNPRTHTIYTPQITNIQDTLTLAGSISTDQIATLRFKNSGRLNWVGVKVGDRVRRGQAIASLDRAELRKNLATQYNNYRKSLSEFQDTQDTYKTTRDKALVTDTIQRILDRTQYSLDNAVINYEITDMAIKESVLTSPLDGILVSADQPFAGVNITPAGATFIIISPDRLFLKAEIDQEDVNRVSLGQRATLRLDSFPADTIESKITFIAFTPVSGQSSTVYEIRFDLPLQNKNLLYRIGMDGEAEIVIQQADSTLTIPTDSVNDDGTQRYVYIKTGNQLERRDIKTGIENDTTTQVIDGLSQNDQIIVSSK